MNFKIIYTKHADEKFKILKQQGWIITKTKIRQIIRKPKWSGLTKEKQETALDLIDQGHIIRIILRREENGIIRVITFHIGRIGKYESR
jgi:hypothetical protein